MLALLVLLLALGVAAAAPSAQAATLNGTVTDSVTSLPVDNLHIDLYRWNTSSHSWNYWDTGHTDPFGGYSFSFLPPGDYTMYYYDHGGYYLAEFYDNKSWFDDADRISLTVGTTTVDYQVSPPATIDGDLTYPGGTPAVGVNVELYERDAFYGGWDYLSDRKTNASGHVSFGGLGEGTYVVSFNGNAGSAWEFWDDEISLDSASQIDLAGGATYAFADELSPAGHITGHVTTTGGAPLPWIWVSAEAWDGTQWEYVWSTSADVFGAYDIGRLPAHDYRVRFEDENGHYITQYYSGEQNADDADPVIVAEGATVADINAQMVHGCEISGQVTDTRGYDIPYTHVDIYESDGFGGWQYADDTTADDHGAYEVRLLDAGVYRVGFSDRSGEYVAEFWNDKADLDSADDVGLAPEQVATGIDAELALKGAVTGKVTVKEGWGVYGVNVALYQKQGGDWAYVGDTSTDWSGVYLLDRLDPGRYRIGFEKWDTAGWWDWIGRLAPEYYDDAPTIRDADDVTVAADRVTRNIDAQMGRFAEVGGTVTDSATGTPLTGIDVTAFTWEGAWEYAGDTSTDSTGAYNLDDLYRGTYKVRFRDPSGTYRTEFFNDKAGIAAADDLNLDFDQVLTGVDAQLEGPATISGTITDEASGDPVSWEGWIEVYEPDGHGGWQHVADTWPESDGTYTFGGLSAGTYRVHFAGYWAAYSSEWYKDGFNVADAADVTIVDGEARTGVDFALAPKSTISGRVTNPVGDNLGGIQVEAYRYNGSDWWEYVADASTDSTTGAYVFPRLDAGQYKLRFADPKRQYGNEWFTESITEKGAKVLDMGFGSSATDINETLEGSAGLSGNVTDSATGDPLAGVQVEVWASDGSGGWEYVWDTSGWGWTETDGSGNYSIAGLPPGTYHVGFMPWDDTHVRQYFKGAATLAAGDDIVLAPSEAKTDINGSLEVGGAITGTVMDSAGVGIYGVDISAWVPDGSGGWEQYSSTWTDTEGGYRLAGLNTGAYRLQFADWWSIYTSEWFSDAADIGSAKDVDVTLGDTTAGIDVRLVHDAEIGSLSSPTHPAMGSWYADPDPSFAWTELYPGNAKGYSWSLDHDPDAWPDKKADTSDTTVDLSGLGDGVWWFHVRGVDAIKSWGPPLSYSVRIDTTAPEAPAVTSSTHPDPTAWYASNDPVFNWTGADATSGVANYCYVYTATPTTVPDPLSNPVVPAGTTTATMTDSADGQHWLHVIAQDAAGNWGPAGHCKVQIDTAAPTTSVGGGDALWHATAVTLTFTPIDSGGAGMAGGAAKTEYRLNGGSWTTGTSVTVAAGGDNAVDYRSQDAAGNLETFKTAHVLIDTAGPTVTDNTDAFWHNTPVTVTLTPTDPQSGMGGGLAKTEYRLDGGAWTTGTVVNVAAPANHTNDGTHAILYRATDALGNTGSVDGATVKIDTTAPTTTDDAPDAWQAAATTVTLTPTDAGSGISGGLAKTEYKLDGAATWTTGTSVLVSGDGIHTLVYRSLDAIGNTEADQSATVKIESAAPTTADDSDGLWHNASVTVRFTATDGDSGVAYTEYSLDAGTTWTPGDEVTITADPAAHSTDGEHAILYRSADGIGHLEADKTCTVRIDTQGPATKALARAKVRHGRTVTLKYQINDLPVPGSPTATVQIKIKNRRGKVVKTLNPGVQNVNSPLSVKYKCTLKAGRYRFWIYATDAAGNLQQTIGKGYLTVR